MLAQVAAVLTQSAVVRAGLSQHSVWVSSLHLQALRGLRE